MKNLLDNLMGLGRRRLLMMGVTALGIVAALGLGLGVVMSPSYRPFVTDATAATASQMVAELEQAGFAPRVSPDGTMISLPEEDIARARMALAEAGLPPQGDAGWELFDSASGIGMNSFLQRVNRLRALEGELARSIETIDIVEQARVHLVLPEREAFSQDRPEASASIIVRTRRGMVMERRQALAVRSLVAAAVPELSPARVTVLSATGEAILTEEDAGGGIAEERMQIEERLRRNIESILGAHVGAENVRVRVAADIDTSRQVVVEESFDPGQQVARVVSSTAEESQSQDSDPGAVDVANNLPGIEGEAEAGGSSESRERRSEETQFEIGSTRSELVTEAGGIRRLTVAVVVNGIWDGESYTERSPEDLQRLEALVRSAAGIDDSRGDTVTVESLRFAEGSPLLDSEGRTGWSDFLAMHFGMIVRSLIALGIVAMVLLLAVRPALRQVAGSRKQESEALALPPLGGEEAPPMMMALGGPMAAQGGELALAPMALPGGPEGEGGEDFLSFSSFSGSVMRRYVDDFSRLIDTEPESSMRTIRAWINQKN